MALFQPFPRLWTQPNWIRNLELSVPFVERDYHIQSMEQVLMDTLGATRIAETIVIALTTELQSSYGIENEYLDETLLYSSVIQELNLEPPEWRQHVRQQTRESNIVAASVQFLRDLIPMTPSSLCYTHGMMDSTPRAKWGAFRTCPIYVVSGKGEVVYEGPLPEQVPAMMEQFCDWWNNDRVKLPLSARAACAHAFFVLIHPFEDGNGRMSRLLAEKALITSKKDIFRPYGMSRVILSARKQYAFLLQHIHDPVNANGIDGFGKFVNFIQDVREQAITRSIENAKKLMQLEELFSRMYDEGIDLSPDERTILKTMNESSRRWTRYEATLKIEDPQAGVTAWNHLIELGVIQKSRIQFNRV